MQADDSTKGASSLRYDIRVKGHLDARWAAWFGGLSLTNESDGTTVLHGPVVDQAALHGLLQKLRDIGMPLVSVTQREPDDPDAPADEGTDMATDAATGRGG